MEFFTLSMPVYNGNSLKTTSILRNLYPLKAIALKGSLTSEWLEFSSPCAVMSLSKRKHMSRLTIRDLMTNRNCFGN
jgi:hypothetical protein